MLERLDELEAKVGALVDLIASKNQVIDDLEAEKEGLAERVAEAEKQLDAVKNEKVALEKQIQDSDSKQDKLRARVREIIERIDRVESNIAAPEGEQDHDEP